MRVLIYRLCDSRERVQSTPAIHFNGVCRGRLPRKFVTSPVTRRGRRSRQSVDSEYDFWSGARDLNPGPHGPEPCRRRVLECPGGFSGGRLNSNGWPSCPYVTSRNRPFPGMPDPPVIQRRPDQPPKPSTQSTPSPMWSLVYGDVLTRPERSRISVGVH